MDPKYSNIFWHQGVKVFEEDVLKTEKGRIRVAHLENDVTKALINVLEHSKSKKVMSAFLQLIGIKEPPSTFKFDFQVIDKFKFRSHKNRIMLCIVSDYSQKKSYPEYSVKKSIPDACIFNDNTAVLIEVKTQSPLVEEQIEKHVENYFGTKTKRKTISWESISRKFKSITVSNPLDKLLIKQFRDFLELIGIAEFTGFRKSDFRMLDDIGKVPTEDYIDFKRIFMKKVEKFTKHLDDEIKQIITTKNFKPYIMRSGANIPEAFSAFYFYDESPNIHINKYPNINFIYGEAGIQLTITGEIKSSFNIILKKITQEPEKFSKFAKKMSAFNFFLYYKVQFLPMNNFLWNLVPGFPQKMGSFQSESIMTYIKIFEKNWHNFLHTTLFQMKSNVLKHSTGRFFNEKEIDYAANRNPKPHFAIRIGKRYDPSQVHELGKEVVTFFKNEISKLNPLIDFVRP